MEKTIYQTFNEKIKEKPFVESGSDLHEIMHRAAQVAMVYTGDLNGSYHSREEVNDILSKLWNIELDEDFTLFPPFNTDYGKNTSIGKGVFINSGCKFQDQGGISIGD